MNVVKSVLILIILTCLQLTLIYRIRSGRVKKKMKNFHEVPHREIERERKNPSMLYLITL